MRIEFRDVPVSNLDKILYPQSGLTKADVIHYYIRIAPALLPHLKGRPLTLKRYPDGVNQAHFYQKDCPDHRPPWIDTALVPKKSGEISYCLTNDLPTLVWLANLADLEFHTFLHTTPHLNRPTALAFDLDPGAPAGLVECCEIALEIRSLLERLDLTAVPKTSGSKGLQIYVPLNTPTVTYEVTKPFAHAVAQHFEKRFPQRVVSKMAKTLRRGRVLIDWSQNDEHKTTVAAYSLRAVEPPNVSTPLTWAEVERGATEPDSLAFLPEQVIERVAAKGDLFEPVLKLKQKLPPREELNA